jgi:hypothetical protein
MAITFKYGGATFTADTPQEAADTLALLKRQEVEEQEKHQEYEAFMYRKIAQGAQYMKEAQALVSAYDESKFSWTRDRFISLIDRLGEPQKMALALLVAKRSITDAEMRDALKVTGNQALAGVLSGISKQAIALYIPPRAIFDFENFRAGGKRRSEYLVVDEFRKIAADVNWPPPDLLSDSR